MFSAYSWGDFIKFILAIIIPYYAFVFWKYYRHDFREWISGQGQKAKPAPAAAAEGSDDQDDDVQSRFAVSNYDDDDHSSQYLVQPAPTPVPTAPKSVVPEREKVVAANWLPDPPAKVNASQPAQPIPSRIVQSDIDEDEVDINGPDISQHSEETIGLPIVVQTENPEELLLDEVIATAKRIKPDQDGRLAAIEPNDPAASRLAAQINNQQGIDEFADMNFTR